MKAVIKVSKPSQKVLLDAELLGQFSDGFWENSSNQSWHYLRDVEISSPDEVGVYFEKYIPHQYRGYSVNNSELLSYVGERMLTKARVSHHLNISKIDMALDLILENNKISRKVIENEEVLQEDIENAILPKLADADYWRKKALKAIQEIKELGGTQKLLEALNNSSYQMKDMRKDLKEITKILKNVQISE